jgi:hypothetical protein
VAWAGPGARPQLSGGCGTEHPQVLGGARTTEVSEVRGKQKGHSAGWLRALLIWLGRLCAPVPRGSQVAMATFEARSSRPQGTRAEGALPRRCRVRKWLSLRAPGGPASVDREGDRCPPGARAGVGVVTSRKQLVLLDSPHSALSVLLL